MKVIGVDIRDLPTSNIVQRMVPPDMLDAVLPEADVVFVSVPHTPKSEGMMGAREFELMKQGSYFIAMSRGKIYDHAALVKALDSRRLAGAGLFLVKENIRRFGAGMPLLNVVDKKEGF
jgi:phosphoglycerate dehydrogenase-like enzyme